MASYSGKRIIMTGASGGIGSGVLEELKKVPNIRIAIFTRNPRAIKSESNVCILPLNLVEPY